MSELTIAVIEDETKLQLALQKMLFMDSPPELGDVYTDGECLYGHVLIDELLLWTLAREGDEYKDLKFVLLPKSEASDRTISDMLCEVCADGAWE